MQDEKISKLLEEVENILNDEEELKQLEEIIGEVENGVKGHEALLQLINSVSNVASVTALFSIKNELEKLNNNISDKLDCDFFQKTLSYIDEKGNLQKDANVKNADNKQETDFSKMIFNIFENSKSKIEDNFDEKDTLNIEKNLSEIMNLLSGLGITDTNSKKINNNEENIEDIKENEEKFSFENEEEIVEDTIKQEEPYSRYNVYAEIISQYYDYILGVYDEINKLDVFPSYLLYGPIEKSNLPEDLKKLVKNNVSVFYNMKDHISNNDEKKCELSITDNFVILDGEKIEKEIEPNAIKNLCIKDNIYFIEERKEDSTNLHLYIPQKTKKI